MPEKKARKKSGIENPDGLLEYTFNNYRVRKVAGKYFISTDHGSYTILDENDYRSMLSGTLGWGLYHELEIKEIILNERNIKETERNLRKKYEFLNEGPTLHIIVPTMRCNMKCVYCQAGSVSGSSKGHDMDAKTADSTVDFILSSPAKNLTIEFQGGEPLLNLPIIKRIVEELKRKNSGKKKLKFTIVTNLTEMDEEKMRYFIDENIVVCSSLDGPKELHNWNRRWTGGSSYDAVVKWTERFNREYRKRGLKTRLNSLVTLTRKSLGFHREIIDEYVRLGMRDIALRPANRLGIASKAWDKISFTDDEYLGFWRKSVGYIEELRSKEVEVSERMVDIFLRKLSSPVDIGYMDLRSPCGAAIGQIVYNYNGDIYTCDEARMIGEDLFLLGNVNRNTFQEAVACDNACAIISASINDQYICESCAYKPFCGICPVLNYALTGSIVTNISSTSWCRTHMARFDWVVENRIIGKGIEFVKGRDKKQAKNKLK